MVFREVTDIKLDQPRFREVTDVELDQPQDQDFWTRTAGDLEKRGAQLQEIFRATRAGEQTYPEAGWQTLGTEIGALGDIAGQAVTSGVEALPEVVKEPFRATGEMIQEAVKSSAIGTVLTQKASEAIASGVEAWESFKKENPRAARNIEATVNVGAFFTPVKGVSPATATAGAIAGTTKGAKQAAKTLTRKLKANPVATSDEIRNLAGQSYKLATEKGGALKPEFTNKFVDEVLKLKPQTEIGVLIGGDSPFTKVVDKIAAIKDKTITLDAAQELDELLGDAIDGFTEMGRLTKQGKKLFDVQSKFRNMIENASDDLVLGGKEGFEALKEGRKLWATSRKMEDIERIISRAESMDNPGTGIKTGFRTLYHNPNRMKGFTKKEKELIKRAATTGVVSDVLRVTLGSRLIPIITGATGGGLGVTAAATAGSLAARGAGTKLQVRKAQDIAREIAKGAGSKTKKTGKK